jgi:transketolase
MGIRVIHVLTHDSIGLGQDGPTHQPVEHLAALRAIPNLLVLRPADAVETAEAWQLALKNVSGPTALVLTRQNVPPLRAEGGQGNQAAKGAYVLQEAAGKRQVTLLASGSEVSLAVDAAKALAAEGIAAAVVSVPSFELFARQERTYRDSVLGTTPRVAIEAAIRMSWDRYLRDDDVFIGMEGFGASGPGPEVYKHFGITSDAVVAAARKLAGRK